MDKQLKDRFYRRLIYISSVVEGVKLKKSEVTQIVQDRKEVKMKIDQATKDLKQAYGQKLALDQIEKWAKQKSPIDLSCLSEIHEIVFNEVEDRAGQFRNQYVKLRSSSLLPSFPFVIQADINDLNRRLLKMQRQLAPTNEEQVVDLITHAYHQITKIHPFSDGNGRSARLFINLLLRRYGYPYIVIPKVDNMTEMRKALQQADQGDEEPLKKYMRRFLSQSFKFVKRYQKSKVA